MKGFIIAAILLVITSSLTTQTVSGTLLDSGGSSQEVFKGTVFPLGVLNKGDVLQIWIAFPKATPQLPSEYTPDILDKDYASVNTAWQTYTMSSNNMTYLTYIVE